jgi:hypothetical protein
MSENNALKNLQRIVKEVKTHRIAEREQVQKLEEE